MVELGLKSYNLYWFFANCCRFFEFFGFTLKGEEQQGQRIPFHFIKTSHTEHRFCPDSYLPTSLRFGFFI